MLGLVTRTSLAMENNGVTNHLNIVACAASHNQATPSAYWLSSYMIKTLTTYRMTTIVPSLTTAPARRATQATGGWATTCPK